MRLGSALAPTTCMPGVAYFNARHARLDPQTGASPVGGSARFRCSQLWCADLAWRDESARLRAERPAHARAAANHPIPLSKAPLTFDSLPPDRSGYNANASSAADGAHRPPRLDEA